MLASYHDGELDWEATWGAHLDELLEWRHVSAPGGEKRYLPIQDRRRNIVALYDTESFTLTALADYTAQGHRTALDSNEAVVCEEEGTGAICDSLGGAFPFGFNTAWRSSRTGLYAMRHRWYSPTLGEFLSHDPLEEVDSFNLYAFAAHDPINSWDPFGLRSNSLAQPGPTEKLGQGLWNIGELGFGIGFGVGQGLFNRSPLGQGLDLAEELGEMAGQIYVAMDSEVIEIDDLRPPERLPEELVPELLSPMSIDEVRRQGDSIDSDSSYFEQGRVVGNLLTLTGEGALASGGGAGKSKGARRSPRTRRGRGRKGARGKGDCLTNSFEGATLVLMCDGTQMAIEELEEGDWVWARDVLTGQESCEQVTETFVHEDDQLLALTLRSELSGEYERLVVTHDHPMLSPEGEEVAAYALKLDQRLGGLYDDFVVVALEPLELVLPVHNLSVQHAHTFFVGGSAVWAHNADCSLDDIRKMHNLPKKTKLTKDNNYALKRLAKKHGVPKHVLSDRLHDIKPGAGGRGGRDNILFDADNGTIYSPQTGEDLGSLIEGW